MYIKKVDNKPMEIHEKKIPQLHVKEVSKAKARSKDTPAIRHGPGNAENMQEGKTIGDKGIKQKKGHNLIFNRNKTGQTPKNAAIKKKSPVSDVVASVAARSVLDEVEGGNEICDAYMAIDALAKPVTNAADIGKNLYRSQMAKAKQQKFKKKQSGSRIKEKNAKENMIKKIRKTTQMVAKKAGKKAEKTAVKEEIKASERITEVIDSGSIFVGITAGEASASTRDKCNEKYSVRNRMISLFVAKIRQEENQDSVGKALKEIVLMRFSMVAKYVVRYAGLFLLALFAAVAVITLPIIVIITIIYNSPFAVFFPSISSGETVQDVLTAYMSEFNETVNAELADYVGYDTSEKIYMDFEGSGEPDNFCDILMVYMVKHGNGDTATDMTDNAKQNLKVIFDDMCSYSISNRMDTGTDDVGSIITTTVKEVYVELKSCYDMVSIYGFSADEQIMLVELMKPGNLAALGYAGGDADPGEGISPEQYQAIVDAISDQNGKKVVAFALAKVGYPYSQRYRNSGKYYDCSSLAYYAWRNAGINIMHEGSNTAASEGKLCYDHNLLVNYDEMQPGDLIFYSSHKNGRFMNITHVAIYVGNGKVVEAANARLGVVYRPVRRNSSIVFIGRPR